jgi:hypothetical protein
LNNFRNPKNPPSSNFENKSLSYQKQKDTKRYKRTLKEDNRYSIRHEAKGSDVEIQPPEI